MEVRIEISNAAVAGSLDLRSATVRDIVSLVNCQFGQVVDFSYSTVERSLDLSDSTMHQGIIFKDSLLKRDLNASRMSVGSGEAEFEEVMGV